TLTRGSAPNVLILEIQLQAIVRKLYVLRQRGVGFGMAQIVRNMGEKSALRTQSLHQFQRILHIGVRRMRAVAQRIEKKNVQVAEFGKRRLRDVAEIGEVSGGAEAVAINLRFAVHQPHRTERRPEKLQ